MTALLEPLSSSQIMAAVRCIGNQSDDQRYYSADWMAGLLLPRYLRVALKNASVRRIFRWLFSRRLPGGFAYITAKSRVIDDWVSEIASQRPNLQVVILGSGLDSRAQRLPSLQQGARVIEMDQASALDAKRIRVAGLRVVGAPVSYVGATLGETPPTLHWFAELGVDTTVPSLFILDGLSYFLTPDLLQQLFEVIGQFPDGSDLVFDYAFTGILQGERYRGSVEFVSELERMGEAVTATIDPETLVETLEKAGLRVCRRLPPAQLEAAYLSNGEGASIAPYGFLELVHAQVQL